MNSEFDLDLLDMVQIDKTPPSKSPAVGDFYFTEENKLLVMTDAGWVTQPTKWFGVESEKVHR